MNKLDSEKVLVQSTIFNSFSSSIEKCNTYNEPLHLVFVDYNKAFDSEELWTIFHVLHNAIVDSRYKDQMENIYNNATSVINIPEDIKTNKIPIKTGGRQSDTISPKLFTLILEDVFRTLDWDRKGIKIDGRYLNHLRFADDVVKMLVNCRICWRSSK